LADGIAVKTPGKMTFDMVQRYVDEIVTVDENEIASAILFLLEKVKTVSEGAGAVSVAAIMNKLSNCNGKKIVAIVSGGNIDVNILSRIIDRGLVKSGRKVFFDTLIPDKPGRLWRLLQLISDTGANILAVNHERDKRDVLLGYASVEIELETADEEQIHIIEELLKTNNYSAKIC
jgi:threonine dehydratase